MIMCVSVMFGAVYKGKVCLEDRWCLVCESGIGKVDTWTSFVCLSCFHNLLLGYGFMGGVRVFDKDLSCVPLGNSG